jgi:hypothetical protein
MSEGVFAVIGVMVGGFMTAGLEALAERRRERRERRVRRDERLWESCVALVTHGAAIAAIHHSGGITSPPGSLRPSDYMEACSKALTSIRFLGSPGLVALADQFFDALVSLLRNTSAVTEDRVLVDRERLGEHARKLTGAARVELGFADEG